MLEYDDSTFDKSKSMSDEKRNECVPINFMFGSFRFILLLVFIFIFNKGYSFEGRKKTALNHHDFFFCHINRSRETTEEFTK